MTRCSAPARLGQAGSALLPERIRPAMKAGNTRLVTVLAGQMPADYQTIASAVIGTANDPNTVLTFARTTGATDFTRQMAAVALPAWRVMMWKTPG